MGKLCHVAHLLCMLTGLSGTKASLANAATLADQRRVWDGLYLIKFLKHGPQLLVRLVVWLASLVFLNRFVLWYGGGVPGKQFELIVRDKVHIASYIARTFDGVAQHSHLRKANYFYYNCLMGRFTRDNCPAYLRDADFRALKAGGTARLDVRTGTFLDALRSAKFTKVVLMDHADWLEAPAVAELAAALREQVPPGGKVIWRSASFAPPYAQARASGSRVACRVPRAGRMVLCARLEAVVVGREWVGHFCSRPLLLYERFPFASRIIAALAKRRVVAAGDRGRRLRRAPAGGRDRRLHGPRQHVLLLLPRTAPACRVSAPRCLCSVRASWLRACARAWQAVPPMRMRALRRRSAEQHMSPAAGGSGAARKHTTCCVAALAGGAAVAPSASSGGARHCMHMHVRRQQSCKSAERAHAPGWHNGLAHAHGAYTASCVQPHHAAPAAWQQQESMLVRAGSGAEIAASLSWPVQSVSEKQVQMRYFAIRTCP